MSKWGIFILLFIGTQGFALESGGEIDERQNLGLSSSLADLEEEPYANVHGVNVITGEYTEVAEDMAVGSIEPILLQRSYRSSERRKSSQSPFIGWEFNQHGSLLDQSERSNYLFEFRNESGQPTIFRKIREEKQGYPFRIYPYAFSFSKGYMHFPNQSASSPHPYTTQMICHSNLSKNLIIDGSGNKYRFAKDETFVRKNKRYLLKEILRPSGLSLNYTYDREGDLIRIDLCNRLKEITHTMSWKRGLRDADPFLTIESSSGDQITYLMRKKRGCLEISSNKAPKQSYFYNKEQRVFRKAGAANQTLLEIDYDQKGRVKELREPTGPEGELVPIYRFTYESSKKGEGKTLVSDALGYLTLYHYGEDKRLTKIQHLGDKKKIYSQESFFWTFDGELVTRSFEDGMGKILFIRGFTYDSRGNVASESVYGNLTGNNKIAPALNKLGIVKDNGCEVQRKKYRYSRPYNLLLEEENGPSTIRYVYEENSNRLQAMYHCEGKEIRFRHFYEYDKNGALILEIEDDGHKESRKNLAKVSERHITRLINRDKSSVGLPKIREEYALDLKVGSEVLCHKVHSRYDPFGHLIEEEHYDSEGKKAYSLTWEYDPHGYLIKQSNALGQATQYSYDREGNLLQSQGPDPKLIQEYSYDQANRLIQEVEKGDEVSLVKKYLYDKRNQKVQERDFYDQKTWLRYDAFGRLIETKRAATGALEKSSYNVLGHVSSTTRADGGVIHYKRNIRGQPTEITHPDASVEHFEYTVDGLLAKRIAPNQLSQNYSYDWQGRCVGEITKNSRNEQLQKIVHIYNSFHHLSTISDHGRGKQYQYDAAGRVQTVLEGEKRTSYSYDSLGRCSMIDENGIKTQQQYDLLDRLIEEIKEEDLIQYAYDAAGRCTDVISQNGTIKTAYNARGQPISVTDENGFKSSTCYQYPLTQNDSKAVSSEETAEADGGKVTTLRDSEGRVLSLERLHPSEGIIQRKIFSYDLMGRMISCKIETPLKSLTTCWKYNKSGQLTRVLEGAGTDLQKKTDYTYNKMGLRESVTKADAVQLFYTYDERGRLSSLKASDGSVYDCYTYDSFGHVAQVEDRILDVKKSKFYDEQGRCIREVQANGLPLSTTYDALDRKLQITLPNLSTIYYSYSGLQLQEVEYRTEKGSYKHTYGRTNCQLIGKAGEITSTRDEKGRISAIHSPFWNASYLYDGSGKLIQCERDGCKIRYQYDGLGQLVKEDSVSSTCTYGYDSLYNRDQKNEKKYQLNAINQLTNDEERQYSYDLCGRLSSRILHGKKQLYTYDALDRLKKVTEDNDWRYVYQYDEQGLRLSKTHYKCNSNKNTWEKRETTLYLYCDHNEIAAYEDAEQRELRILGVGLGGDIAAAVGLEKNGRLFAPVHDLSGHLVCLIDSATGKLESLKHYSAFGEVLESAFEGLCESPWGFSSKRLDPETGFLYFGQRYYDPFTSRWITPDPLGNDGGPNLYTYVLNNPLTHFDREGLFLESIGAFVRDTGALLGHSLRLLGDHLLPIPYLRNTFSSLGCFLTGTPIFKQSRSHNGELGRPEFDHSARIVAVNGILNDRDQAKMWAENVSSHFGGSNVHYCYNSSHGFIMDILECIAQKLGLHTHSEEKLIQMIREKCGEVGEGGKVHLLSHSQGGLLVSNALTHLRPEERSMLHVVTFGSASMIAPKGLGHVHNYINSGDPIPWFSDPYGIMRYGSNIQVMRSSLFEHSALTSRSYQRVLAEQGSHFLRNLRRE